MKNYKCKTVCNGVSLIRIKYDVQNLEDYIVNELKRKISFDS